MGPPMSENQLKKSQSCVASPHPLRQGMGLYKLVCQIRDLRDIKLKGYVLWYNFDELICNFN